MRAVSRGPAAARSAATAILSMLLVSAAAVAPAPAGAGFLVSPPLQVVPALASGLVNVECAVLNLDATRTAHVAVEFRDAACAPLGAGDLVIGPGAHASASVVTAAPPTAVTCAVDLDLPDNPVRRRALLASFSVRTLAGQPRTAVLVDRHVAALPDCRP